MTKKLIVHKFTELVMYDKFRALLQQRYLRVLPDFWSAVNGIEVDIDPCALEKHVLVKLFIFYKPSTHCWHWREQPCALLDTVLEVGQLL